MAEERTPSLTLTGVLVAFLDPSYQYWCIKVRAWITWRGYAKVGVSASCIRLLPMFVTHHRHVCRLKMFLEAVVVVFGKCARS